VTRLWAGRPGFIYRWKQLHILIATASRPTLGGHTISYPMDTGSSFLGAKRPWCGADQVTRLRTHGAILPLPHTSSWRGAQLKHRANTAVADDGRRSKVERERERYCLLANLIIHETCINVDSKSMDQGIPCFY
jgi:hypothetical protein